MKKTYTLNVAGLTRSLPLCPVNEDLYIGAFIMFGDVELTKRAAAELLKKIPACDVLATAESKGIPLVYEMARQSGRNTYVVMRKGSKLYMEDVTSVEVDSITTDHRQILCVGSREAEMIRGKRVLLIDDVISTGETMTAMEALIEKTGGTVAGRAAVLAEGEAVGRKDIVYLAPLPVFDGSGREVKHP